MYPCESLTSAIVNNLTLLGISFTQGPTWTTDAPYRETYKKRDAYRSEILTVEMEAAALFAISQYLGMCTSAILSAGDSIGGKKWDSRRDSINHEKIVSSRHHLILIALQTLAKMDKI